MFGRAIWNKLPECIFENFEAARVKRGESDLYQKLPEPNIWLLVITLNQQTLCI